MSDKATCPECGLHSSNLHYTGVCTNRCGAPSEPPTGIEAIEDALAELLETYAALREHYIHPVPEGAHDDHHRANLVLRTEANTYRNAAYLLRHHREESASIGLPSWKWDEWQAKEREVSARLTELTGGES